jgi:predicted nucleic acid-binding protein
MIYCDSSFLVPLYLYEKGRSEAARRIASQWIEAPIVSPLSELEFTNTVCRKVLEKEITAEQAGAVMRDFREDLKSGIYSWPTLNLAVMFRDAVKLSLQHTPDGGHRSLDVLHVAAAKLCAARQFLSYDERLNRLARLEAMVVLAGSAQ